jgi:hypothetical protein
MKYNKKEMEQFFGISFTPDPDCPNCSGTGIFNLDDRGNPLELCVFCTDGAIIRGEIDGTIDGVKYVRGKRQCSN